MRGPGAGPLCSASTDDAPAKPLADTGGVIEASGSTGGAAEEAAAIPAPATVSAQAGMSETQILGHLEGYYAKHAPGTKTDTELQSVAGRVFRGGSVRLNTPMKKKYGESFDEFVAGAGAPPATGPTEPTDETPDAEAAASSGPGAGVPGAGADTATSPDNAPATKPRGFMGTGMMTSGRLRADTLRKDKIDDLARVKFDINSESSTAESSTAAIIPVHLACYTPTPLPLDPRHS